VDASCFVYLISRWRRARLRIHAAMDELAFEGVGAVVPLVLDVFEVEQAGAVRELIDHPSGQLLG